MVKDKVDTDKKGKSKENVLQVHSTRGNSILFSVFGEKVESETLFPE